MKVSMTQAEFDQFKAVSKANKLDYEVVQTSVNSVLTWRDGPVLTAMKRGCVLLLDEIDQARTSAIMGLNTIAQGQPYYNKKTNDIIVPAEGFQLIGTANTKGDGEGSDVFAGSQIMNEAFLERFSIIVEQPYPTKTIERKILQHWSDDEAFINTLLDIAHANRKQFDEGEGSIVLTTRRLVHIVKNASIFGNNEEGLKYAIARFNKLDQAVIMELYKALSDGA